MEGTDAIFAGIKKSLDHFDRQMETREIDVTSPPSLEGETLSVTWAVTYTRGNAPPIRIAATTTGTVRDGRIVHLSDTYDAGQEAILRAWLDEYAPDE